MNLQSYPFNFKIMADESFLKNAILKEFETKIRILQSDIQQKDIDTVLTDCKWEVEVSNDDPYEFKTLFYTDLKNRSSDFGKALKSSISVFSSTHSN